MKCCSKCESEKPAEEFHRCAATSDGLQRWCKDCIRASQLERKKDPKVRQRMKEARRRWREENLEKERATDRARYARDREKRRAWAKQYHAANPEKQAARSRAHYERHRQRRIEGARRWDLQQLGVWTAEGDEYARLIEGDPCAYCGGPADTLDHIVPTSQGGMHDALNITRACRSCNASKNDRPLLIFLAERERTGVPAP